MLWKIEELENWFDINIILWLEISKSWSQANRYKTIYYKVL